MNRAKGHWGTARILATLALVIALLGNVSLGLDVKENCNGVESLKRNLYIPAKRRLDAVKAGKSDVDYKRIYGTYLDGTKPHWQVVKRNQIEDAEEQLDLIKPHTCILFFGRS